MNVSWHAAAAAWHRLATRLEPYPPAHAQAPGFRARQIHAVLRLGPLIVLANVVNALLVAGAFWSRAELHGLLLGWGLLILLMSGRTARAAWRARRSSMRRRASERGLRRVTLLAALLALLWSVPPLWLFADASSEGQLLVATVTTGMMCAGGFALATVPRAGTAYVLILGVAAAVALATADLALSLPLAGLLAVYTMIVLASVWATAMMFGARLVAEAEAERQNEVIGLLLRDFEENASDVLWEIDARGRLRHTSPRLAALFGLPPERLARRSVLRLLQTLAPDDAGSASQLAALRAQVRRGKPFRDLPLATRRDGRTSWWSLSAKPLVDGQGRVAGWRGVASDVTAAQHANRQLTWLAHFDPLTGLANRHQLRTRMAELLSPPFGDAQPFAVLCLDLDHFKTINDTFGHAIGDALLQEIARRLQSRMRRQDIAARLGGDEFAIVLPEVANAEDAGSLVRRLLDDLVEPCEVLGARIPVRTSIGVSMAPADGVEIDVLLNNADLALYAAKSAGRGEFRFFAPQMATLTRRRLVVEQELRGALDRRELRLEFQPQVELDTWRVSGFEALLRWRHPRLGDVAPTEFVPIAEESGLLPAIGHWVLQEACRQAAGWPAGLRVSVNVSPVQAMSHDLGPVTLDAARSAGLDPRQLEIEITESVFLDESRTTLGTLHRLHEAGVRIALDDFGTGYSSLAYLRRFPFDTLKIDRSFVRELLLRRDARAIVRMIVGLSRTLAMRTVAEGVETPEQAAALRDYGCRAMQGFLIAGPMGAEQVRPFLDAWARQPPPLLPAHPPTTSAAAL